MREYTWSNVMPTVGFAETVTVPLAYNTSVFNGNSTAGPLGSDGGTSSALVYESATHAYSASGSSPSLVPSVPDLRTTDLTKVSPSYKYKTYFTPSATASARKPSAVERPFAAFLIDTFDALTGRLLSTTTATSTSENECIVGFTAL